MAGNISSRCAEIKRLVGSDPTSILIQNGLTHQQVSGDHGPCPFPGCKDNGGKDRWRRFPDGGGICGQCGTRGDFIAVIKDFNGWTLVQTVETLEKQLRIDPKLMSQKTEPPAEKPVDKQSQPDKVEANRKREFVAYYQSDQATSALMKGRAFERFASRKPPIRAEDIARFAPLVGSYLPGTPNSLGCLAFPGWHHPDDQKPGGWILRREDCKDFPATPTRGETKTLLITGSKDSWSFPDGPEKFKSAARIWVTEGILDAIAILPHMSTDEASASNLCGAGSTPKSLDLFVDKNVVVLGDNDEAGKQNIRNKAIKIRKHAKSVKIVFPPRCKDVRDFLADGGTFEEIRQAADTAVEISPDEVIEESKPKSKLVSSEEDTDPHRLANVFHDSPWGSISETFNDSTGKPETVRCRRVRYFRSEFQRWNGHVYEPVSENAVRCLLTQSIKEEFDRIQENAMAAWRDSTEEKKGDPPKTHKVTIAVVSNVLNALKSMAFLSDDVVQPSWLDGYWNDPNEIVATHSGLLHLPSISSNKPFLRSLTSDFFNCSVINTAYDPAAACPAWAAFLESIWGEDPQSIALLQEWFGVCLTQDTSHHKMMLCIGPPRSGKGTIGRLAKALFGRSHANPTLSDLSRPFGLWPLLGKSIAIVSDARLSGQSDTMTILERLLSISGGDPQNVDRKCLPTVTAVSMPVRFWILTNELFRLPDSSGALASRFLILRMTKSFLDAEDKGLDAKLGAELPGILNWAIAGWQRLQKQGRFTEAASSKEMMQELRDLSSPVGAFVREWCKVAPGSTVETAELYAAWRQWCELHGRDQHGTDHTFGRDLRAVIPGLKRVRPTIQGNRIWKYEGVGLLTENERQHNEQEASCRQFDEQPFITTVAQLHQSGGKC